MAATEKEKRGIRREADRLARLGYRRISNSKFKVARIDSDTWQASILAISPNMLLTDQAEDFYRRNYSEDTLVVSTEVYKLVPGSSGDTTGFINEEGEDVRLEVALLAPDEVVVKASDTIKSETLVPDQKPLTLREKFVRWLANHGIIH